MGWGWYCGCFHVEELYKVEGHLVQIFINNHNNIIKTIHYIWFELHSIYTIVIYILSFRTTWLGR